MLITDLIDTFYHHPKVPAKLTMSRLVATVHFLLFFPFRISYSILNRIFPFLSAWLPLSWTNRFSIGSGGGRGPANRATDPASVADRWVRQLEEETGAICESRVGLSDYDSSRYSSISSGAKSHTQAPTAGPGPSTLSSRRSALSKNGGKGGLLTLPDFYMGSYETALRLAEKEMRAMCVVLVSEEHDDVADFKRCAHYYVSVQTVSFNYISGLFCRI